jgi:hypothetical protein
MAAPYPLAGEGREGVVIMRMCPGIRRHVGDVAVAYAALRDDVIRKCFHLGAPASEHSHLKATVVVEMDMEGCLRKAVMGVEILGQALGQLARGVVVDIAQGGDAIAVMRHFEVRLRQARAGQIANRFRAIGVAAPRHKGIDLGHEIVVDRDCHALHGIHHSVEYDDLLLTSYSRIPTVVDIDKSTTAAVPIPQ